MHINRKRQSDHPSALDAQTSAQQADATRQRYGLQRVLLACFGVLGTAGLLALAGCPANLANPEDFDKPGGAGSSGSTAGAGGGAMMTGVDLTCVTGFFTTNCTTNTACHAAGALTGLDLTPGFESRLLNVTAKHMLSGATDCPTVKLVDTSAPTMSWLLKKVTPGAFGDCGLQMPLGATAPLAAPDLACLTKFLNDEAAAATGKPAGTGGASGATTAGTGGM